MMKIRITQLERILSEQLEEYTFEEFLENFDLSPWDVFLLAFCASAVALILQFSFQYPSNNSFALSRLMLQVIESLGG